LSTTLTPRFLISLKLVASQVIEKFLIWSHLFGRSSAVVNRSTMLVDKEKARSAGKALGNAENLRKAVYFLKKFVFAWSEFRVKIGQNGLDKNHEI
jgi:hypothetical protein